MYTDTLKSAGVKVIHDVTSARQASRAEAAGVDAVVAEGMKAAGIWGRPICLPWCLFPRW